MIRAAVALVATAVLVVSGAVAANATPVDAGSSTLAGVSSGIQPRTGVAGFNAANIMSDATFYDSKAMTSAEIQRFLDQRIAGACRNGKCINQMKTGVSSKASVTSQKTGNLVCNAMTGGTLSVAEIIYRTQVACGISAKVILVMLQKEQGLVTSTAPSDWNLRAAMGAYCPDTAPCDPSFAGIGPQIYAGVKQLKMYKAGNFAMQPGSNFITYHPDTSRQCGGSTLNIANYATAALYNYTPYQPNAAALRAGYGEGDRCSSYGNRNFYSYYTDWFGSTQGGGTPASVPSGLAAATKDIYFVSGGKKYYVGPDVYSAYLKAFGAARSTTAAALASLSDGPNASLFLHNSANGAVSYLADNARHQFASCSLVAAWGGACDAVTSMTATDFAKVPAGANMSAFGRLTAGGALHRMDGRTLIPVYDAGHAQALNNNVAVYAPVIPTAVKNTYSVRKAVQFAPGRFITPKSSSKVFMPAMDGTLIHLPAWGVARDLGLTAQVSRTVPDSLLTTNPRSGTLSFIVGCSGKTYLGSKGTLYPVTSAAVSGFAVTQLDAPTCGRLSLSTAAPLSKVFVSPEGRSEVYLAQAGQLRHVTSYAALVDLAGPNPRVLTLTADTVRTLPISGPLTSTFVEDYTGKLVKTASSNEVSLVTGVDRRAYLPSFGIAAEMGLSQKVTVISDADMRRYRAVGSLGLFTKCGATTYFASQGVLEPVAAGAATGHAVTTLETATCHQLKRTTTAAPARAYITTPGSSMIYIAAQNGTYRHVTSLSVLKGLNGGTVPKVFTVSATTLAALPKGTPVY